MMTFLIVCPLVFLAGFVDAIGGGGGLISLPTYMLAGIPVHQAIATNKLSSCMGTTVAAVKYARQGYMKNWKLILATVAAAIIGSPIGAELSLHLDEKTFEILMLGILPFTAFYVIRKKSIDDDQRKKFSPIKTALVSSAAAFLVGTYDGFYGPGTGTFLMLLLAGMARLNLKEAAGTTKAINLTTNIGGLIIFILNGKVVFLLGLAAGIFNMAGNYLGAKCFTEKGSKIVKPIIITVLVIFMVKIII